MIVWHIESHLLQTFRDTCWIPTQGIEWKLCIKKDFQWFLQACLGMYYVGTLATPSRSSNMRIWPLCAKISHSLTEKNPSFQNWPKQLSLLHGSRLEGHPSTISMSKIQWSWRFVDPSNGHDSMACWIPPPPDFQGHLLNPYPGHRMETVHKKGLLVGRASAFRHVLCGNAWKVHRTDYYIL